MKQKEHKRGFLLHAFGYKDLNYIKLAACSALSIKAHLKENHVTLVTDADTKRWMDKYSNPEINSKAFDNIIVANEKFKSGTRRHFDSPWFNFKADFNNQNRTLSYQYTPYEETMLIDVDYLVMSDSFDHIWGNDKELIMNYKAIDLQQKEFGSIDEKRLGQYGIPMYWATVVYFKQCDFCETFFNLIEYIRDEYNFFQFLYGFKKGFYRNDFAYSIAAHIMSGNVHGAIPSFPEDAILSSYQQDAIADVIDSNEIIFISNDRKEPWKDTLVNITDMNVHVMNKKELLRVADKYIGKCLEKI